MFLFKRVFFSFHFNVTDSIDNTEIYGKGKHHLLVKSGGICGALVSTDASQQDGYDFKSITEVKLV